MSSARTVVLGSEGMVGRERHLQQELVPLSRILPIPWMRKSMLSRCSRCRAEVALGPDFWPEHMALWPLEKGTSYNPKIQGKVIWWWLTSQPGFIKAILLFPFVPPGTTRNTKAGHLEARR